MSTTSSPTAASPLQLAADSAEYTNGDQLQQILASCGGKIEKYAVLWARYLRDFGLNGDAAMRSVSATTIKMAVDEGLQCKEDADYVNKEAWKNKETRITTLEAETIAAVCHEYNVSMTQPGGTTTADPVAASNASQQTAITQVTQQLSLQQVGKHLKLAMPNGGGARPHPVDACDLISEAGAAYSVVDGTITDAAARLVMDSNITAQDMAVSCTAEQAMKQHLHSTMQQAIGPVTYNAWLKDSVTGTDGLETMHALMSVATDIKPAVVDKKAVAFDDFAPLPLRDPGGLADYYRVWRRQAKELEILGKFKKGAAADNERIYDSAYRMVSAHPQQALAVSTIWNSQKASPYAAVQDIYEYIKKEGEAQIAMFGNKPQWTQPEQLPPQLQPPSPTPYPARPVPQAHRHNTRHSQTQKLMDEGKCIRFHTTGQCTYGARCKFKHGDLGMANMAMTLHGADIQELMELTAEQDWSNND